MKREIKFRVWLSNLQHMFYSDELDSLWEFFKEITPLDKNDYLMQFTGLKDKNGKEIYEGDILRLLETIATDDPAYPYYCNTMEVVYSEPNYRFGLTDGGALLDIPSNVEVIGNIYENPELLK